MKPLINICSESFILLAGEVHNSNSSSIEVMELIWQKARKLNLNTLFLPITWELLEPEEGKFDFSIVDQLIEQARKYELHIGFLWFGGNKESGRTGFWSIDAAY